MEFTVILKKQVTRKEVEEELRKSPKAQQKLEKRLEGKKDEDVLAGIINKVNKKFSIKLPSKDKNIVSSYNRFEQGRGFEYSFHTEKVDYDKFFSYLGELQTAKSAYASYDGEEQATKQGRESLYAMQVEKVVKVDRIISVMGGTSIAGIGTYGTDKSNVDVSVREKAYLYSKMNTGEMMWRGSLSLS
jgi:hypothetical protein